LGSDAMSGTIAMDTKPHMQLNKPYKNLLLKKKTLKKYIAYKNKPYKNLLLIKKGEQEKTTRKLRLPILKVTMKPLYFFNMH
jgi:hypothetical protein